MGGDATKEPPFFFTKPADCDRAGRPARRGPRALSARRRRISITRSSWSSPSAARGAKLAPERALRLVYGYAVGLDMTRRDLQNDMREKKRPWDIGKSFAASGADRARCIRSTTVGPSEPRARSALDVNGARRQQGDLADMIWDVPHTLHFLSQYYELMPGDLVFTGTPAGVGAVVAGDGSTAASKASASCASRIVAACAASVVSADACPRSSSSADTTTRAAVPDHPQWFARWAADSAAARARLDSRLDLRYGSGPEGNAGPVSRREAPRHASCSSTAATGARSTRRIIRSSRRRSSRRASAWPWSTTICAPTSRSRASSTNAGEAVAWLRREGPRTALLDAATGGRRGIRRAAISRRCCSPPTGRRWGVTGSHDRGGVCDQRRVRSRAAGAGFVQRRYEARCRAAARLVSPIHLHAASAGAARARGGRR